MYKPDFPQHNYIELQRSKIGGGDSRCTCYETTYQAANRPRTSDIQPQQLDTAMLQRTHWTPGTVSGPFESEYTAQYRRLPTATRKSEITRDMMMGTHFRLGDGTPMERRVTTRASTSSAPRRESLREQMEKTHFDLKDPKAPKWTTTTKEAFIPSPGESAPRSDLSLLRGAGAKECFACASAFPPTRSLAADSYRPPAATPARPATHHLQRTSFSLGDGVSRWTTTTGEEMKETAAACRQERAVDPHYAFVRRLELAKSHVNDGNCYPSEKTSTSHAGIVPHPDCRPPPPVEASAFRSHHDFRNWDGRPTTTQAEAYTPKLAALERAEAVNNRLQDSHMRLGASDFGNGKNNGPKNGGNGSSEMTTLYRDTFVAPKQRPERADVAKIRDFHMGTHSKTDSNLASRTGKTTNQETYTGCQGGKASEMCDALRGGHNIVPNEPRYRVQSSTTHDAYVPHPELKPPEPVNNKLQRSHINMSGGGGNWTTTQSDYFQFRTYRMPGDPRYGTGYVREGQ